MDQKLIDEILKFRDDREWKQFHNPKDLAISLSLEAAELLENFQWSTSEENECTATMALFTPLRRQCKDKTIDSKYLWCSETAEWGK